MNIQDYTNNLEARNKAKTFLKGGVNYSHLKQAQILVNLKHDQPVKYRFFDTSKKQYIYIEGKILIDGHNIVFVSNKLTFYCVMWPQYKCAVRLFNGQNIMGNIVYNLKIESNE
ncbi:hypothetical protein OAH77_04570 [Flavobacteriaceae bacterium]|nr:hypothetical protein [Flavobacteriaceae bacterium]